jgi:hypothetical protein
MQIICLIKCHKYTHLHPILPANSVEPQKPTSATGTEQNAALCKDAFLITFSLVGRPHPTAIIPRDAE